MLRVLSIFSLLCCMCFVCCVSCGLRVICCVVCAVSLLRACYVLGGERVLSACHVPAVCLGVGASCVFVYVVSVVCGACVFSRHVCCVC